MSLLTSNGYEAIDVYRRDFPDAEAMPSDPICHACCKAASNGWSIMSVSTLPRGPKTRRLENQIIVCHDCSNKRRGNENFNAFLMRTLSWCACMREGHRACKRGLTYEGKPVPTVYRPGYSMLSDLADQFGVDVEDLMLASFVTESPAQYTVDTVEFRKMFSSEFAEGDVRVEIERQAQEARKRHKKKVKKLMKKHGITKKEAEKRLR